MAFEKTLRYVQIARAVSVVAAAAAIALSAVLIRLHEDSRQKELRELLDELGSTLEIVEPAHSIWGKLAIIALGFSLIWNTLSFIDLCTKRHYRFGRRVYIFVDMIAALMLLLFGFLNFAYDAVMFYALEIATKEQYIMEMHEIVLLALVCFTHLGFFCYGCKDPDAPNYRMEHVEIPQDSTPQGTPTMAQGQLPVIRSLRKARPRASTFTSMPLINNREFADIELDRKERYNVEDREVHSDDSESP